MSSSDGWAEPEAHPGRAEVRALALDEVMAALVECERRIARVQAEQAVLIADLHRRIPDQPHEWAREEIAVACRIPDGQARTRLRTALALDRGLELTRRSLQRGDISFAHATAMNDATDMLTASEAAWVERRVLDDDRARTPGQLAFRARQAAMEIVPQTPDRPAPGHADRALSAYRQQDGGVSFYLTVPAPDAAVITIYLDAAGVRQGRDDDRSGSTRRADALVDLVRAALDTGALPSGGDGRRPHVELVASLESLQHGRLAADIDGVAVRVDHLRELFCEADVRTTIVDSVDRMVLDQGRTTRVVSAALRGLLDIRDQHCRFPGCEVRARRCRAHHIRHWADGGPTDLANLVLVCERHHHAIHDGGWQVELREERAVWHSPTGQRIAVAEDLADLADPDDDGSDVDHWIRPWWEFFHESGPPAGSDPTAVPDSEPEPVLAATGPPPF